MTATITSIPLHKLVPWSGNVRKTGVSEGLGELTASIAAHGLLQSLIVRKTSRGKFAVIAGQRRLSALSALAGDGAIASDMAVPCRILSGTIDATEISLTENVVRAPMHPADQFDAFLELVQKGAAPADIAARFGISEGVVRKRLKLARVSPAVLAAYRNAALNLEQVQAFTVTDDRDAQETLLGQLGRWNADPETIRRALTQDDIAATDKRVRFVGLAAYEEAGGAFHRDLFSEGEEGVFILDAALLDRLAEEKLASASETLREEGWKWVEAMPECDYDTRSAFERLFPEPAPLSEADEAEVTRLSEEYDVLYEALEEDDEEACTRMDAIEARIGELREGDRTFTSEALAMAGAIVSIAHNGELEVIRGLVRPEDAPERTRPLEQKRQGRSNTYSSALTESLTSHRSAALSATLASQPDIALAAVAHAFALKTFHLGEASSLQLSATITHYREAPKGAEELEALREGWQALMPDQSDALWEWCLAQDRETLLKLLAFCAACTVDAIIKKHDARGPKRLAHADALARAVGLNMTRWFTPTAENFFRRIGKSAIVEALSEAKGMSPKHSWSELKKADLALLAEREITGSHWLPPLLRA